MDGEITPAMEQRVHERSLWVTGSRMHNQAGRLVDDEDRVILVQNVEIQGFWFRQVSDPLGDVPRGDSLAGAKSRPRLLDSPIDPHGAGFDPTLNSRPRAEIATMAQKAV
jgi:hypothetical protein